MCPLCRAKYETAASCADVIALGWNGSNVVLVMVASGDLATMPQSRIAAHGEATWVDASPPGWCRRTCGLPASVRLSTATEGGGVTLVGRTTWRGRSGAAEPGSQSVPDDFAGVGVVSISASFQGFLEFGIESDWHDSCCR